MYQVIHGFDHYVDLPMKRAQQKNAELKRQKELRRLKRENKKLEKELEEE